jgi:cytochrome c biogenesis protein
LTQRRSWTTPLPPSEVLAVAETVLGRRRFRRRRVGEDQLAAERGHWREGGSLVFHSAFFLLLVGIVVGHTFGFTGQINLVEGSAFADTRIAYDAVEPGRAWSLEDHRGFVTRLDDFEVSYFDDFTPRDFVSSVTVLEDGVPVRSGRVRVNHPLVHDGMKLYQARFGMAPRVLVRAGDRVLFDEPVMLADAGGNVWTGAAKVAVAEEDRQIALDLALLPDADLRDGMPVSVTPQPRNPRLVVSLYFGALGLEQPVPASSFDRGDGPVGPPAILGPGETGGLADGNLTVEFGELRYWSGFQVSHAPGRGILLTAAGLVLVGLVPSLYSYRRRIWVEARPVAGGTEVLVAGVALQRKPAFAEEFAAVTDSLRGQTGSTPGEQ